MSRTGAIKKASVIWVVAGMLASTAAVVYFWPAGNELTAAYWRDQLATASDERATECLTRLTQLGDPGVRMLVESLASPRPQVASRARTLLLREIDAWESLPTRQTVPRLTALAEALADHAPKLDASGRSFAAEVSLRIMRWRGRREAADQGQLLAACERILRATGPVVAEATPDEQIAGYPSGAELAPDGVFSRHITGPSSLPGGGIPADPAQVAPPREIGSARTATASATDKDQSTASSKPLRFQPPVVARPVPTEAPANDPVAHAAANPQPSVAANQHAALNKQAAFLAAVTADEAALVSVMRQLHSPDSREAAGAQAELQRRGFKPAHLELAWTLTDNDPNVRKQLAEALPGVAGIDARPWYLWLSHDEDAGVRLAAVSFMVTSADPQLRKRVEELARTDPDPRIQQRAGRPSQKRR